jgi:hypothetical protein
MAQSLNRLCFIHVMPSDVFGFTLHKKFYFFVLSFFVFKYLIDKVFVFII